MATVSPPPDEYFYAGVTAATVIYKKADGATESVVLEPSPGTIMSQHANVTYLEYSNAWCGVALWTQKPR